MQYTYIIGGCVHREAWSNARRALIRLMDLSNRPFQWADPENPGRPVSTNDLDRAARHLRNEGAVFRGDVYVERLPMNKRSRGNRRRMGRVILEADVDNVEATRESAEDTPAHV